MHVVLIHFVCKPTTEEGSSELLKRLVYSQNCLHSELQQSTCTDK